MIVCLCKNVTDREIKEMASKGQRLCDILRSSEAGTCCGSCTDDIRKILKAETVSSSQQTG